MENRNILLAMSGRNPALKSELTGYYQNNGYNVYCSNAKSNEEIDLSYRQLEADGVVISTCIYFALPLFQVSVFDVDFTHKLEGSIDEGLIIGAWWIRQTCEYHRRIGGIGNMIILNHIPSIVPTQKYSYCCINEAALTNLGKVTVMDTEGNTDIRINFVTYGWLESDQAEREWNDTLAELHKGAKAPILKCVTGTEVAEACMATGMISGMNGNNLILDHGFSISRSIKQYP